MSSSELRRNSEPSSELRRNSEPSSELRRNSEPSSKLRRNSEPSSELRRNRHLDLHDSGMRSDTSASTRVTGDAVFSSRRPETERYATATATGKSNEVLGDRLETPSGDMDDVGA